MYHIALFYAAVTDVKLRMQDLKPSIAFTALALFNVMRFPLNTLPMIINFVVEGRTALTRLSTYLLADEIDPRYYANCGEKVCMRLCQSAYAHKLQVLWENGGDFSCAHVFNDPMLAKM